MNANEKLRRERARWEPTLRARIATMGKVQAMAAGMALPQLEEFVDDLGRLPADEIDAILARLIDRLAQLRSDGAAVIVAWSDGAFYAPGGTAGGHLEPVRADPLQRPGAGGGALGVGQVDGGPGPVPVGGGAPAGHRPG